MSEHITQMMTLLCNVTCTLPVGTNLALVYLWMMVSGQLLLSRGSVIPGLHQTKLSGRAVRRGWQALRRGSWSIGRLLVNWEATVMSDGGWQARYHGTHCALPGDYPYLKVGQVGRDLGEIAPS